MKIREHPLSQGKRENFIQGSARQSLSLTKIAYNVHRLRHTVWSWCEFWITKCFPPFYAKPPSKITHLYHSRKKTKLKCWQKCCLRASSNCSLRPLPYSQDCILKRGRKGGKSHTTHSQNMTLISEGEAKLWVSPVQNRQGHSHLLDTCGIPTVHGNLHRFPMLAPVHLSQLFHKAKRTQEGYLGGKVGSPSSDKFD